MKMWRESEKIRDNCGCVADEESPGLEINGDTQRQCHIEGIVLEFRE